MCRNIYSFSLRRKPAVSYNPCKERKPLPYVRRPIDYTALDHVGNGGVRVAQKGSGGDGDSADTVSINSTTRDYSTLRILLTKFTCKVWSNRITTLKIESVLFKRCYILNRLVHKPMISSAQTDFM